MQREIRTSVALSRLDTGSCCLLKLEERELYLNSLDNSDQYKATDIRETRTATTALYQTEYVSLNSSERIEKLYTLLSKATCSKSQRSIWRNAHGYGNGVASYNVCLSNTLRKEI